MKNSNKILYGLIGSIAFFGIISMVTFRSTFTDFVTAERIQGNNDFKTETRTVPPFENLQISSFFDVILEQANQNFYFQ